MNQLAIIALAVVLTASHAGAYFMGRSSEDSNKLKQAVAYANEIVARQAAVDGIAAELEAERAKRTPKDRVITREVVRYETLPADRRCTLDPAWRLLHDAAATGAAPEPARVSAGDASPVTDAAALETVAINYEQCRTYIEQLTGWQRWWREVGRTN